MNELQFIKCHGSGNDFLLIDAVACKEALRGTDLAALARAACDRTRGVGSDGILILTYDGTLYGMLMFNPDGSQAGMCGNGIRCVARLAAGYIKTEEFTLMSGGREYRVSHCRPIAGGVETFGVDIEVRTVSDDFAMNGCREGFVERPIEELDRELSFTALDLGNPHLVARVDRIDLRRLEQTGRRANTLKNILPNGVNLSFYTKEGPDTLFAATYERGAGITLSCGTAMTASATAAVLCGVIGEGTDIRVMNRGGMVVCRPRTTQDRGIVTSLTGNATFEWCGSLRFDGRAVEYSVTETTGEQRRWTDFAESLKTAYNAR